VTGNNDSAKRELNAILGDDAEFSNPKPLGLVERILTIATDEGDLVLDSFAGSGTTAHAAMRLNFNEGSSRRFLLVQQPYDTKTDEQGRYNICRKVTRLRVARSIEGYRKGEIEPLGGSFSYAAVGDPLFGEYRDFGEKLPKFDEIAKYIFYTETSREIDLKNVDEKTGFIGETKAAGGTSYYLFYTPNKKEDRELSTETLKSLLKKDKNRTWVIYCEKIWLHGDQLRKFEKDHGKRIRPMLVPFNLK
jgi:adenine-specific DNA-methyltransferase